jgi:hypothetical protein
VLASGFPSSISLRYSQSGIRRMAGALDIRSFLTTAAMSSTGGPSSRVSSLDQCDADSLWHWRRKKMGDLLVAGGGTSRGAPSSHPRRNATASVSLLGLQVRNDVTVHLRICLQRMVSTRTKAGAQARLAPFSSDEVLLTWAGWTPRMCLSHARHYSCRRRASKKIFIPSSLVLPAFPRAPYESP